MFVSLAAIAMLAQIAPAPSSTPAAITTTVLAYRVPTQGYRVRTTSEMPNGVKYTAVSLINALGDRDVDLSFTSKTNSARGEYLYMSGLLYSKVGDAWVLNTVPQPAITNVLSQQNYIPPATFQLPGRTVKEQGKAPCGDAVCASYAASAISTISEQPIVLLWNLLVAPGSHYLYGADYSATKAEDGSTIVKLHVTYDDYDNVHLSIPDLNTSVAAFSPPQCATVQSTQGPLEICVARGLATDDVYTLRVAGKLALRASKAVALNGASSPVIDGEVMRCKPQTKALSIDPNLAATLKRSGMSDSQIATSLGSKDISTDCAISSFGSPLATAHIDFK